MRRTTTVDPSERRSRIGSAAQVLASEDAEPTVPEFGWYSSS
jgi:hypothetical protein